MMRYAIVFGSLLLLLTVGAMAVTAEDAPPVVTMTTPINAEDSLDGTVGFTGTASDDNEVTEVEWRIDDLLWFKANGTDEWFFELDTTTLTSKAHKLYLRASDGLNFSSVLSFDFTVNQIPWLEVIGHVEGKLYKGAVEFMGEAYDDIAVVMVEVKVDTGNWKEIGAQVEWKYEVPTDGLEEGKHTFEVRVWDGEKYSEVYSTTFKFEEEGTPGFGLTAALAAALIAVPMARWRRQG
jgi:PGF-CTERM protein